MEKRKKALQLSDHARNSDNRKAYVIMLGSTGLNGKRLVKLF
jgi:hypothetical protein